MKILIWDYPINLKNSGGPAGYLYNIAEYLKTSGEVHEIVFLKDLLGIPNNPLTNHLKYAKQLALVNKIDKFKIWDVVNTFRKSKVWSRVYNPELFKHIDFNQFDIIHFHVSYHVLASREALKEYKGIKVLTTHAPQPLSEEFCTFPALYNRLNIRLFKRLRVKELEAWQSINYLMFPVPQATEVYFRDTNLKNFILKNPDKLCYCPSALKSTIEDGYGFKIQEKLGIPKDAFVLTYIGRHNVIKGYDQLLKLGEKLLDEYPNLYVVVAGNQQPLSGLKHKRWIELGWINYGQQLMNQSDAFILPNKETYFDLVALEVLRAGTPIILSETGGNRYFKTLPNESTKGMFFYDYSNPLEVKDIIGNLMELKASGNIDTLRFANKSLFATNFSMRGYIDNYLLVMRQLLKNK